MKVYFFLLLLIASACCSNAEDKNKKSAGVKAMIIREIMRKISNITLNSLSKVPDHKKALILNKIEQKLKKTAAGLADGFKYVKLIMAEFRNKAYNKTEQVNKIQTTKKPNRERETNQKETVEYDNNEKETIEKETNARETKINAESSEKNNKKDGKDLLRAGGGGSKEIHESDESEKRISNRKIFDNQTKENIIKDISNKIESMAKGYLRQSQTFEQKQRIFQKIKQRIVDSSKRKHMLIHNQHNELKAYTNLITQGLEMTMNKLLLASKSRRMDGTKEEDVHSDIVDNHANEINLAHINEYKSFFSELWNETSIDPRCEAIIEEICIRIGSLRKLTCGDGNIITLNQLCDGVSDCWNGADETNCSAKAIEKSHLAIALITDIDQSMATECFQPVAPNSLFSEHHQIVRDILRNQLRLLQKTKKLESSTTIEDPDDDTDKVFMRKSITDVTMTLTSLSDVFDLNLCSPRDEIKTFTEIKNATRKSIDPLEADFVDEDSMHEETNWLPRSCSCKDQFCKLSNCDTRCKRICWQKYSLNMWQCQAITGDASISLDLMCDGKLDCYDETDEISCTSDSSITKYEANAMYKDLLEIISLKSLSMEFEHSRNKIAAETGLVRQLQKLSTKSYVDVHAVKVARDEYFKTLVHIFEDTMQNSKKLEELDDIYEYLHILNVKMVGALKLSHIGNEHVHAPAGCFCNNGTCALVRCSKKCNATCVLEPSLTKFSCNDNTTFVNIKAVCNGKKDCPNEEDEKDCRKEVCRSHHLVVLRHNLQKAGMSLKGSVLGDILDSWKAKVMPSLIIAQGSERPNHKMLEDIVVKVLRDLVTTYATMEETKKTNSEFVTNEFKNMSAIVKQTLKLCEK